MPGPIPNRSDDLSRKRDANRADRPDVKRGELRDASRPDPDPEWHPIATMIYNSLAESGQVDFYQSSDWAMAYSVCEDLSVFKRSPKRNGQILATIYAQLTELLATEGARRRLRIELSEPEEESDAEVVAIDDYKAELGVGK